MAGFSAYLTEQKYNDVLNRHGQHVRWLRARTCTCITQRGRVDPKCVRCQGRGKIYDFQTIMEIEGENSPHNRSQVCPKNTPIHKVHSVKRQGYDYIITEHTTELITINFQSPFASLPAPYNVIVVDYSWRRASEQIKTSLTHYGDNLFKVNGLVYTVIRDDRIIKSFPVDIITIVSAKDTTDDYDLPIKEFRRDIIEVDSAAVSYAVFAVDQGTKTFTITGNAAPTVLASDTVVVSGSTGNDGSYTVVSVTYDSVNDRTAVEVSEAISDATVDGTLASPEYVVRTGHEFQITVEVVPPFKFVVSGLSDKNKYEDAYTTAEGEGQMLTPFNMYIGNGDLVTLLSAQRREETLLKFKSGQNDYELMAFHIVEVLRIEDADGNNDFEYGTDFILWDYDKIRFLSGGKKPSGAFNVQYLFHPTYSIFDDIPMDRSGEDKQFPRKVMLKQFKKMNQEFDVGKTKHGFGFN